MELTGLEPVTSSLRTTRSSQLSYNPNCQNLPSVAARDLPDGSGRSSQLSYNPKERNGVFRQTDTLGEKSEFSTCDFPKWKLIEWGP